MKNLFLKQKLFFPARLVYMASAQEASKPPESKNAIQQVIEQTSVPLATIDTSEEAKLAINTATDLAVKGLKDDAKELSIDEESSAFQKGADELNKLQTDFLDKVGKQDAQLQNIVKEYYQKLETIVGSMSFELNHEDKSEEVKSQSKQTGYLEIPKDLKKLKSKVDDQDKNIEAKDVGEIIEKLNEIDKKQNSVSEKRQEYRNYFNENRYILVPLLTGQGGTVDLPVDKEFAVNFSALDKFLEQGGATDKNKTNLVKSIGLTEILGTNWISKNADNYTVTVNGVASTGKGQRRSDNKDALFADGKYLQVLEGDKIKISQKTAEEIAKVQKPKIENVGQIDPQVASSQKSSQSKETKEINEKGKFATLEEVKEIMGKSISRIAKSMGVAEIDPEAVDAGMEAAGFLRQKDVDDMKLTKEQLQASADTAADKIEVLMKMGENYKEKITKIIKNGDYKNLVEDFKNNLGSLAKSFPTGIENTSAEDFKKGLNEMMDTLVAKYLPEEKSAPTASLKEDKKESRAPTESSDKQSFAKVIPEIKSALDNVKNYLSTKNIQDKDIQKRIQKIALPDDVQATDKITIPNPWNKKENISVIVVPDKEFIGKTALIKTLKNELDLAELKANEIPSTTARKVIELNDKYDIKIVLNPVENQRKKEPFIVKSLESSQAGLLKLNSDIDTGNVVVDKSLKDMIKTHLAYPASNILYKKPSDTGAEAKNEQIEVSETMTDIIGHLTGVMKEINTDLGANFSLPEKITGLKNSIQLQSGSLRIDNISYLKNGSFIGEDALYKKVYDQLLPQVLKQEKFKNPNEQIAVLTQAGAKVKMDKKTKDLLVDSWQSIAPQEKMAILDKTEFFKGESAKKEREALSNTQKDLNIQSQYLVDALKKTALNIPLPGNVKADMTSAFEKNLINVESKNFDITIKFKNPDNTFKEIPFMTNGQKTDAFANIDLNSQTVATALSSAMETKLAALFPENPKKGVES